MHLVSIPEGCKEPGYISVALMVISVSVWGNRLVAVPNGLVEASCVCTSLMVMGVHSPARYSDKSTHTL